MGSTLIYFLVEEANKLIKNYYFLILINRATEIFLHFKKFILIIKIKLNYLS